MKNLVEKWINRNSDIGENKKRKRKRKEELEEWETKQKERGRFFFADLPFFWTIFILSFKYSASIGQVFDEIWYVWRRVWPLPVYLAMAQVFLNEPHSLLINPAATILIYISIFNYFLQCWILVNLTIQMKSFWNKDEISFLNLLSVFRLIHFYTYFYTHTHTHPRTIIYIYIYIYIIATKTFYVMSDYNGEHEFNGKVIFSINL